MATTTHPIDGHVPGVPADLRPIDGSDFDEQVAFLNAAREHHPWGMGDMGPVVLRHADVATLLHSSDFDQVGMALLEFNGVTDGVLHDWWSQIMFANEGDRHRRLREAVRGWLTPKRVADLAGPVRAATEGILAGLPPTATFDLAAEVANPIPIIAICALLGVDTERVDELGDATTEVGTAFGIFDEAEHRRIVAGLELLLDWGDEALTTARPGTLARSIADAASSGDLDRGEAVALIANLLFAAHDTTRFLLANAFWLLGRNPVVWQQLVAADVDGAAVAEETVRCRPPAARTGRVATTRTRIGDLEVEAGELVGVSLTAAGRDPRVYTDPDVFDPARPAATTLSFWHGVHYCIGAALARLEASVVIDTVVAKCPELVVDSAGAHTREGGSGITGIDSLPARLR